MFSDRISNTLPPEIVRLRAQDDPHGVFAQVPAGTAYSDGFRNVTNLQLHNAVNFTAGLIRKSLGESKTFETLAFIGPSDPRYIVMVMAGMKTGYKIFLPSPRNSEEAHVSLLERLQCTKLVVTEPQPPCVPMILKSIKLQTINLPSLQQLLTVGDVEEYPYTKTFIDAQDDPAYVLHTSGSTGIPKPLIYTPRFVSKLLAQCQLAAPEGFVRLSRYSTMGKFVCILPPFHAGGIAFSGFVPLYFGSVPVYPLPGLPPTAEDIIQAISNAKIDWAFLPPTFVDELGKRPDLLDVAASRLKYIIFSGGAAPNHSGDVVAKKIPIWQVLGSSEAGFIPLMHAERDDNTKDWNYVCFSPAHKFEMQHCYNDLHELVLVRDESLDVQAVFTMFPETKEFHTRDLFKPHPKKEGLWSYHSREDDVIVFLNGEKTNPITFEEEVISHPHVKAALVIGAQRDEAALLVELIDTTQLSEEEKKAAVQRIWPVVERANNPTPAHARIAKSKILLVNPEAPMARSSKGTVQRKATLELYAAEIDKLYQQDEEETNHVENGLTGSKLIKSIVRDVVAELLGLDDLDFFQMGMDSLGALRLRRAIQSHFPTTHIPNNIAYSNSSVNAIAQAVEKLSAPTTANGHVDSTGELATMLEAYTKQIDDIKPLNRPHEPTNSPPTVVLLTGSTGGLGSYLLDSLMSCPSVTQIICLNRTSDAQTRQISTNKQRSLPTSFPPERVKFLTANLSRPSFGLDEKTYASILSSTTHIIHNAWPVNFNLPLSSFTPSLTGMLALINLSAHSTHSSSLQFLSSISSIASYPCTSKIPERVITDLSATPPIGYGQSKYLSERLLDHACSRLGISGSFVRLGQIAGAAKTGSGWNRWEWLPSLVASSAFIGALPLTLGQVETRDCVVDWVPVDYLADVLVGLALFPRGGRGQGEESGKVSVNHIVHPTPKPWAQLLPVIQDTLASSSKHASATPVSLIPYPEWVALLKQKTQEAEKDSQLDHAALAQRNPAMKLLDFYEGLLDEGGDQTLGIKLDMDKTMGESDKLRALEPLKDEWVAGWVKEWMGAVG